MVALKPPGVGPSTGYFPTVKQVVFKVLAFPGRLKLSAAYKQINGQNLILTPYYLSITTKNRRGRHIWGERSWENRRSLPTFRFCPCREGRINALFVHWKGFHRLLIVVAAGMHFSHLIDPNFVQRILIGWELSYPIEFQRSIKISNTQGRHLLPKIWLMVKRNSSPLQ